RGGEALDPCAGRGVDQAGARLAGEGLRQTVADPAEARAGGRVEPEQRAAAGRRPEPALCVEGQVVDRQVQRSQGRARLAAFRAEAEELGAARPAPGPPPARGGGGGGGGGRVRGTLSEARRPGAGA